MKESNILKLIQIEAGKRGYICLRLNSGTAYGASGYIKLCPEGTPDLEIICKNGRVIWVETKTKTGAQRAGQLRFEAQMRELGHKYILARSVEDVFSDE